MFSRSKYFSNSHWQLFAIIILGAVSFFFLAKANAAEVAVQLHKGIEDDAKGYSFIYSDTITKREDYRWGIGYSTLDDLKATWNNLDTLFKNDTIDVFAAYRIDPKTYNAFWRPFTFEAQLGASVSLTENKFIFDDFPDQEIVFSEKGDVNLMVSLLTQYQLSKETKIQLGYKYYPDFSEFGDQSSFYLGFSYRFGKKFDYK